MAEKRELRRRALSVFFLLAALAMLVLGETLLAEKLRAQPVMFLLYWLGCFGFVGLTFLLALLDLAVVRRRVRAEQRELLERTRREIEQTKRAKAEKSPKNSVAEK